MAEASHLGKELASRPSDGITSLQYLQKGPNLVVSSWDGTIGVYNSSEDRVVSQFHHRAPVLDVAVQSEAAIISAGLDGHLGRFDISTGAEARLGQHEKAVRCVESVSERQFLVSGSWDCSMKIWDPKMPTSENCVATVAIPGKAFSMSVSGNVLAVATSQRQILAYDTRKLESGQPFLHRESSLKFQTRCLQCFGDAEGYAISSVEGRVAIEYFESSEAHQAKKFAFKCHRSKEGGEDVAYPVNAIAFQPVFGTFATGGCDGVVNMWDKENKKRLAQLTGYPTSIACLAFNHDGSELAVAASYTFEKGERDHPVDTIFVRSMQDGEIRPKSRK